MSGLESFVQTARSDFDSVFNLAFRLPASASPFILMKSQIIQQEENMNRQRRRTLKQGVITLNLQLYFTLSIIHTHTYTCPLVTVIQALT